MSPIITIPDGIEPIVAYRAWSCRVDGIEPTLLSLAAMAGTSGTTRRTTGCARRARCFSICLRRLVKPGYQFRASVITTRMPPRWKDAPCGFYALKSVTDAFRMSGRIDRTVIGRVKLAGKVIEHEFGYRAQRAGSTR